MIKNMKIKRLESNITYSEKTTVHEFEVNGKAVRVIEWEKDSIDDQPRYDISIDENYQNVLTEAEEELFNYEITEALEKPIGEELIIE
jgi:hypothetical protein